jgi:hypothetical protein
MLILDDGDNVGVVDPVLTLVLAVGDELEVPAAQGMERVRHPDVSVPITRIGWLDRLRW